MNKFLHVTNVSKPDILPDQGYEKILYHTAFITFTPFRPHQHHNHIQIITTFSFVDLLYIPSTIRVPSTTS